MRKDKNILIGHNANHRTIVCSCDEIKISESAMREMLDMVSENQEQSVGKIKNILSNFGINNPAVFDDINTRVKFLSKDAVK